jgi:hypothetical protein
MSANGMADAREPERPGNPLVRFATQNTVRRQRRVWSGRVVSWDKHGSAGLAAVTAALARKGPGGWWRIAKNAARYLLRVQERPVSMSRWTAMLSAAGFAEVTAATIRAEAGLVTGRRPEDSDRSAP